MIKVQSVHKFEHVEAALARAAQRHGANLIAVTPLGVLLKEEARKATTDAVSFTVCHTDLHGALLSADIRFAAFLPSRIAAIREGDGVRLEAISPLLFCRHLERPDLEPLARPLEDLLRALMEDAAAPARTPHVAHAAVDGGLGAHEGQMSARGPLPQRIDSHGTKIEDLAGTGKLDAPGG
ncbi:MAG: hypothetical protein KIT09_11445 [Bryobacteraceae bacterium]|nr:hypothetical protein [Bryobacteraceae bacterium]